MFGFRAADCGTELYPHAVSNLPPALPCCALREHPFQHHRLRTSASASARNGNRTAIQCSIHLRGRRIRDAILCKLRLGQARRNIGLAFIQRRGGGGRCGRAGRTSRRCGVGLRGGGHLSECGGDPGEQ